jgi:pullulanase/glycogen debranching enzyme
MASPDIYGHRDRRRNRYQLVTCHDGFTLNDLCPYNDKRNDANKKEIGMARTKPELELQREGALMTEVNDSQSSDEEFSHSHSDRLWHAHAPHG